MTKKEQLMHSNQKYLGDKGLVLFIGMMNMLIPLSTDLYLPALPTMSDYFESSSAMTNLTLSLFFLFYALGILVWGPLSDKYGRKPILTIGAVIYILSSISCALASSVYFLIAARILQGIGSGGVTSVSVAMIKDCFTGARREKILAVVQSISGIAPMAAPVIGALVLKILSWRWTFGILAVFGVLNMILTFLYQETLKPEEKYEGTVAGSLSRLLVVGKNKGFIVPAVIFSLNAMPFMGYLAVSSYIYVDYFGLSEQAYSIFFAANAVITITGPVIYIRHLSKKSKKAVATACFILSMASGIMVMTAGTTAPIMFMLSFAVMSVITAALRPLSTNILLEQQKGDTGSASSLINTLNMVFGSAGMLIASAAWGDIVKGLGLMITVIFATIQIAWQLFLKSDIPCIGIKQ